MKYKILAAFMLLLVGLVLGYMYINHDYRTNIIHAKAFFTMDAQQLFEEFAMDEGKANAKYLGKVIEVKGHVESIRTEESSINVHLGTDAPFGQVVCQLNTDLAGDNLKRFEGGSILIKGECSGMLMDVILVNGVILTE